jgi:hypothetical protein
MIAMPAQLVSAVVDFPGRKQVFLTAPDTSVQTVVFERPAFIPIATLTVNKV